MLKYIKIFFTGIIDVVLTIVATTLFVSIMFVIAKHLPSANAAVGKMTLLNTKDIIYEITYSANARS